MVTARGKQSRRSTAAQKILDVCCVGNRSACCCRVPPPLLAAALMGIVKSSADGSPLLLAMLELGSNLECPLFRRAVVLVRARAGRAPGGVCETGGLKTFREIQSERDTTTGPTKEDVKDTTTSRRPPSKESSGVCSTGK